MFNQTYGKNIGFCWKLLAPDEIGGHESPKSLVFLVTIDVCFKDSDKLLLWLS